MIEGVLELGEPRVCGLKIFGFVDIQRADQSKRQLIRLSQLVSDFHTQGHGVDHSRIEGGG